MELTVVPDGIYGQQTQNAVSVFQRERGIPVTGVADQYTWERIAAEYPDALTRMDQAEPVGVIMNPGKVFRTGDESHMVSLFQVMLMSLSKIYGSVAEPEITGYYDDITAEAVSSFQFLSALPQTGEMDKVTWKHLALQYPLAVNRAETENREKK